MSRHSVELGFKAFDLHELFPHFVAQELGFYRESNLAVVLRDTTFLPEEAWPENLVSTACGGALCSALFGRNQKILVGAVRGPMFWLVGISDSGWESLAGRRLASFPFQSPPHLFLRILLREQGLDPDRALRLEPVRDDVARLGLLREGQVAAALVSSTVLPSLLKREGFKILAFLGDHLQLPTAGLALSAKSLSLQPSIREALAEAYQRALRAIREDHPQVLALQEKWLPGMKSGFGRWMRALFVVGNTYQEPAFQESVDKLALELGRPPLPLQDVFL